MKRILVYFVFSILYVLSLLPMRLLYVVSDGLYIIVYRLVGYRRKLVRKHLESCFPEKDKDFIVKTEKGFYHWLCDYFVETVKLLSISAENLKRHMVFKGAEKVNEIVETGQSCALYLGHYCNWEWITSLPLWFTPKAKCCQVYHVLENPWADRLFLKLRGRMGAISIPMSEVLRRLAAFRQQGHPVVIGYISDQVPFWNNIHHWVDFLHHDTPVLTGTERLIRGTGQAVFYLDVHRVRRGYYEGEFKLIERNPKNTKDFELTDVYFKYLEASIVRDPQCYLWTHNRWKRTREEFNIRYDEETGRVSLEDLETIKKRKGLL
jgi:KDO2-lipid IV(A) lauroyltransferase